MDSSRIAATSRMPSPSGTQAHALTTTTTAAAPPISEDRTTDWTYNLLYKYIRNIDSKYLLLGLTPHQFDELHDKLKQADTRMKNTENNEKYRKNKNEKNYIKCWTQSNGEPVYLANELHSNIIRLKDLLSLIKSINSQVTI